MRQQSHKKKQIVLSISAALLSSMAYAQPGYYIEKIDFPGTLTANTTAFVNDAGEIVVKDALDGSSNASHFLIEPDGQVTPFTGMTVRGTGDGGKVVGKCVTPQVKACVWDKVNGFTYLPRASYGGGTYNPTEAYDINNNGQVVGIAPAGGWNAYAFVWDSTNGTEIIGYGWGSAISDNGTAQFENYPSNKLWKDGQIIHDFSGVTNAVGVNSNYYTYSQYAVWDPVNGTQGYTGNFLGSNKANAINDSNQIVGTFRYTSEASLWDEGDVFNLEDLLLANPGWDLDYAHDNNNNGLIVGRGTENGQDALFLLTREEIADPSSGSTNQYDFELFHDDSTFRIKDINNVGDISSKCMYWTKENGVYTSSTPVDQSPISYNACVDYLNDDGDFTGHTYNSLNPSIKEFVWTAGGDQIELISASDAINNNDYVLVHGDSANVTELFNYETLASTPLDDQSGTLTYVYGSDLNNNQEVVGYGLYADGSKVVTYTSGANVTEDIGLPNGEATHITDSGIILGTAWDDGSSGKCTGSCSFIYDGVSSWNVLPSFDPARHSEAMDVNDSGIIVGRSYEPGPEGLGYRAVIWKEGKDGDALDLNDMIDPSLNVYLYEAVGITNDGTIVGLAYLPEISSPWNRWKSFILTPGMDIDVCDNGCPHTSVQAAIDAELYGGTVVVGDGTYYETITLDKERTLVSVNGPATTTIDATGLGASVVTMSVDSTVDGFTLTGGNASYGGGIRASDDSVVKNVIATGNTASSGGGVYAGGSLVLENSTVSNNSAGYGGGVMLGSSTVATLTNNRIENNTASSGGGVYKANYGSLTIDKCVVDNNTGSNVGGGVYAYIGGTTAINNSLITNNVGGWNGAGGIYSRSSLTINNSTITGNTAGHSDGVFVYYNSTGVAHGSIIWGNGTANTNGNLTADYSITDVVGTGNVNADPLFVDAANDDYQLQSASPAIDSGSDTSASGIEDDLNGTARPQDGDGMGAGGTGDGSDYDIGAYEYSL
ncbi:choice-of-anchor Q domain-containing protein [Pseudomonadota bacterium]